MNEQGRNEQGRLELLETYRRARTIAVVGASASQSKAVHAIPA
jgi:hypothetical protein